MAIGVHGYNLLRIAPLGKGADLCSGLCVCEVWLVRNVKVLARYSESVVD